MSAMCGVEFWKLLLVNNVAMGTTDVVGVVECVLERDITEAKRRIDDKEEHEEVLGKEAEARRRIAAEGFCDLLELLQCASANLCTAAESAHGAALDKLGLEFTTNLVTDLVTAKMHLIVAAIRRNFSELPRALSFDAPRGLRGCVAGTASRIAFRSMSDFFHDLVSELQGMYHHAENTSNMHDEERAAFDARRSIRRCFCRGVAHCNDMYHVGAHVWRLDGRLGLLSTCMVCNSNTARIGFFEATERLAPFFELPESSGRPSPARTRRDCSRQPTIALQLGAEHVVEDTVQQVFRCTRHNCGREFDSSRSLGSHKGWHTRRGE